VQRTPDPVSDAVCWCLDFLPSGPQPFLGEISTPFLTNLPPEQSARGSQRLVQPKD
jgi:hypothetical protein